ncbi:hypothetical protein [Streptomyces roseolus]|uniref:hypothetical protein n=1 Tax=Streptomyces roseolus TaxID=67358 RepID=UPI001678F2D0|nr:hypothetical protein [Streptomyces roseolus]GGR55647.1 hypothetical protein GCM10010282_55820 [Streptomyces roseolus]
MSRVATTRCVVTLLAVALLASSLLASTTPFAHAHTERHAALGGQGAVIPLVAGPPCDVSVPAVHPSWGDPVGPPQARERHRAVVPRASARPDRPAVAPQREPAAGDAASVTGTPHTPWQRGSRAPSRATLQVFRC